MLATRQYSTARMVYLIHMGLVEIALIAYIY